MNELINFLTSDPVTTVLYAKAFLAISVGITFPIAAFIIIRK